jgi:y4mF family transcriptional regulator
MECTIVHQSLDRKASCVENRQRMHDRSFEKLGKAVRQRRKALGLKQVELAELARCSNRFVHMVEAGKPSLRLDKLLDLLGVLGLGLQLARGGRLAILEPLPEARG